MPLRRVVSQSETISAPRQYETLERGLEAVYGPYSTSAPLHTTEHERASTEHEAPRPLNSLTALSSGPPGVAILTVITRQKSQRRCAIARAKEIGRYRQRGRGRGCNPAHMHLGGVAHACSGGVFVEYESTPCRYMTTGGGGSRSDHLDEGLRRGGWLGGRGPARRSFEGTRIGGRRHGRAPGGCPARSGGWTSRSTGRARRNCRRG